VIYGKPDIVDPHIYGGGALVAIGLGAEFGFWSGAVAAGLLPLAIRVRIHWGPWPGHGKR